MGKTTMIQKERPILFSGDMVRAILDGRKTQTRRVIKPQPHNPMHSSTLGWCDGDPMSGDDVYLLLKCPYGQPGDHLWVRETWGAVSRNENPAPLAECNIEYHADLPAGCTDYPGQWPAEEARGNDDAPKWRACIHMPRWASRITLEVTDVRVERLQSISYKDAEAEGVQVSGGALVRNTRFGFELLWNSVYKKRGFDWDANPYVWVIEFKV